MVRGFSLGLTYFLPLTFHFRLEYSQLRVNIFKDNPKVNVSWIGNEWNKWNPFLCVSYNVINAISFIMLEKSC